MIKKICFITDRYPTKEYPLNTFLDQLVCQFADMGIECTVIAPYRPLLDKIKHTDYHPPKHYTKSTEKGSIINVYCPTIFSTLGKKIGSINLAKVYQFLFAQAIKKVLDNIETEFDAFYGHFITPSGFAAVEMGKLFGKPSYIAYGECFLDQDSCNYSIDEIRRKIEDVNGIVAVSTKNKNELLEHNIIDEKRIGVFPNAINSKRFYKIDRKTAREQLGYEKDDYIIAFVGDYIDRKGVLRVSEALKQIDGVKSIFIGAGPQTPDCPGILHRGRLPHDEIVTYLNAADVFVLPTLAEGCCNAIIEAMACGLPIISSNLPFNDDILDETNSIRINPEDISEIKRAIQLLQEDTEKREELSKGALETVKKLTIEERARKIKGFIEKLSV